jgi:hypothetical protein
MIFVYLNCCVLCFAFLKCSSSSCICSIYGRETRCGVLLRESQVEEEEEEEEEMKNANRFIIIF